MKSRLGKEVDTDAVKAFNEKQIWTAQLDGKIISGTLEKLRNVRKASKQSSEPQ